MTRAKNPEARQGNARGPASAPPALPTPTAAQPVLYDPPSTLGDVGRRVWAEVWAAGSGAYVYATDRYVVERYAQLQERREDLLGVLAREGYTVEGSQGQVVAHPAARLLADVETKLTPLEDRLGLNPEARLRLGLAAHEMRSALDRFLDDDDPAA